MESYPEQCAADGVTFTRELTPEEQARLDPTADWKIYQGDGFSFKYPKLLNRITEINNSTIIDNLNSGMQLDSQTSEFNQLQPGSLLSLYLEYDSGYEKTDFEIINTSTLEKINILDKEINKYAVGCGVDCGFYILEFESNEKYYRLIFSFTGGGLQNTFDQIVKSIKFTNASEASTVDTSDWKTYNSSCGFTVSYPTNWNADAQTFVSDKNSCSSLEDEEFMTYPGDAVDGFWLNIKRTQLGSVAYETTINSLEDYLDIYPGVQNRTNTSYGSYSGIQIDPLGAGDNRSFIFINEGYVYEVNWRISTSEPIRKYNSWNYFIDPFH